MTGFGSLFLKEAREQRVVLAVLGGLVAAVCLAVALVDLPGIRSIALPGLMGAMGVLSVALTVAPNLIPSEMGDGLRFLGRLPVRPRTVFLAKFLFLLVAAAMIGAFGFLLMGLVQRARGAPEGIAAIRWSDVGVIAMPLAAGAWLMAITCVIPKPLAAIPAGAVAFVIVGGPIWWAFRVPLNPALAAVIALMAMGVVVPVLAAYVGFVKLLKAGGPSGSVASWVAAVLACFVLPAWGWSGWERWSYENLDPRDSEASIIEAFLSVDGSRAYLNVEKRGTTRSFAVDLSAGSIIGRGEPGHRYLTLENLEGSFMPALATHRVILLTSEGDLDLVDCATGRSRTIPLRRPTIAIPDELREDLRASSGVRTIDGRRAWVFGDRVEAETPGGVERVVDLPASRIVVGLDGGAIAFAPRSEGFGLIDYTPTSALELTTLTLLHDPPRVRHPWQRIAVPGAWVFWDQVGAHGWKLRNEAGSTEDLTELASGDRPFCAISATRVLVRRGSASGEPSGMLATFDLATRVFAPVVGSDGVPASCEGLQHPLHYYGTLRGDQGRQVLVVVRSGRRCLASFDPATNHLAIATGDSFEDAQDDALIPLRFESPDQLTVLAHHRRIERIRVGSDACEVLFPRQ